MQLPDAEHPTLMFTSAVLGPCLESTTKHDIDDTDAVEEYFPTSKLEITLMENTAYPLTLIVLSADE
ncbi:hypothetical protein KP79_PYT22812 [Mizuhopecten yessoensis]|uniref:Uncharacterized protein n=1 Tax=Mizuhopecten yessoensis TaxID=6573 RepID=A0A210Q6M2_MIZYE|nr:hypothetical protein KP79_PYT22811 [Mizuhopecten yessoensis]OWF44392.1 hypothetical protein KP79_PYT22812 [Mizuhopecten yessoensis]